MNKLFRPKCLRRVLLCLALLFPIVYLCGGLFFGLAGAHGEQMFAEPVYVPDYVQVNSYSGEGKYKMIISEDVSDLSSSTSFTFNFTFDYVNNSYSGFVFNNYGNTYYLFLDDNSPNDLFLFYNEGSGNVYRVPLPWVFEFENNGDSKKFVERFIDYGSLYKEILVPSNVVPDNNSAYTDFIFSQPFAKNNFITALGKDLVNGSTKGFNPMNELFRTINTNIMHFKADDSIAMFGIGYVYYAVNVLIIYEVLILAVKLIMLPLRAVELFDKKEDI